MQKLKFEILSFVSDVLSSSVYKNTYFTDFTATSTVTDNVTVRSYKYYLMPVYKNLRVHILHSN